MLPGKDNIKLKETNLNISSAVWCKKVQGQMNNIWLKCGQCHQSTTNLAFWKQQDKEKCKTKSRPDYVAPRILTYVRFFDLFQSCVWFFTVSKNFISLRNLGAEIIYTCLHCYDSTFSVNRIVLAHRVILCTQKTPPYVWHSVFSFFLTPALGLYALNIST